MAENRQREKAKVIRAREKVAKAEALRRRREVLDALLRVLRRS
jgi:hypothetical protein